MKMLGITGYSGSGKTTLLELLLPKLKQRGLRTAVIKHSHHNMQVDKAGKDSWRMKEASAAQVIAVCDQRWALMTETAEPVSLHYLAQQFDPKLVDLVLVEGFKQEAIPKILLHRQGMSKPFPEIDQYALAVATDYPSLDCALPSLDLNDIEQIADFVMQCYQQTENHYAG